MLFLRAGADLVFLGMDGCYGSDGLKVVNGEYRPMVKLWPVWNMKMLSADLTAAVASTSQ